MVYARCQGKLASPLTVSLTVIVVRQTCDILIEGNSSVCSYLPILFAADRQYGLQCSQSWTNAGYATVMNIHLSVNPSTPNKLKKYILPTISEVAFFYLSDLWKAKFFILWCNISGEITGSPYKSCGPMCLEKTCWNPSLCYLLSDERSLVIPPYLTIFPTPFPHPSSHIYNII